MVSDPPTQHRRFVPCVGYQISLDQNLLGTGAVRQEDHREVD